MKLALVPINNNRVGDFSDNLNLHLAAIEQATRHGAKLIVFPELSLLGYSPLDLLHRPDFADLAEAQLQALEKALAKYKDIAVIVGTALKMKPTNITAPTAKSLVNCAVFLHAGKREVRIKTLLPFYDVFAESRYFEPATSFAAEYRAPIKYLDKKIGLLICEDSWHEQTLNGHKVHYVNPSAALVKQGCDFLINISASPYEKEKKSRRRAAIQHSSRELETQIAYINHFGGQDEILFDGDAFVFGSKGELQESKQGFNGDTLYVDMDALRGKEARPHVHQDLENLEEALVTGIRDYVLKNGFKKVVLGLSGGIDSALVAVLAVKAVGAANVIGISMPSKFSSVHSIEDAEALASNLGIKLQHFPIKMPHSTFQMALKPFFQGLPDDLTEENLQSRLRGVAVMAFSNKFQALALATGNKSEFAMGYTTLYGDMCGAIAPIGDLYKTEVYELSRYINQAKQLIPESTLTKAPSAELRPNQTDQDSLPPYELLDAVLLALVEAELSTTAAFSTLKSKFPQLKEALVEDIARKLCISEYKRRQAPQILRVSAKGFGQGRRYPVTGTY